MNIYVEAGIEDLITLQGIDLEIFKIEKEISNVPDKINEINIEFESAKNVFNEVKEKLKHKLSQKKDIENQILGIEENIKKSQREVNEVKSNDAFKALMIQIENLKKDKDNLETQELEIMEEIDALNSQEKTIQSEYKKKEEEKENKIKEIQEKAEKIKKELEELKNKRKDILPKIDPQILSRYENIRIRKNGIAFVSVKIDKENYFCGGCNMKLTPEQRVGVHKKNNIVTCENCGRMMYLKNNEGL